LQATEQRATAEKILRAAARLFAEKGFANVSVRDISKDSATTAPVLYYYFGSKKGLFDAVVRKQISMSDFIGKLAKTLEAADPTEGLKSFVSTYLATFPEHAFDPGLYMRDSATLDRNSAQRASEELERIRKMTSEVIAKAITKGYFRKADPVFAADCLLGMLNRVIFQHIHFAKSSDRDSYAGFVTDFFFRAMRRAA
jgi:AcrR family transcriptional regulator